MQYIFFLFILRFGSVKTELILLSIINVATFMIDNKLIVFMTEPALIILLENTSGWVQIK